MVDEAVVNIVQRFLAAVRSSGIPVEFGVLFGSWARGAASPESDIDLIVVSPRFDAPRAHRDVDVLWRLAARVDSRIEPLPCGSQQWREDQASPLLAIVRQEGEAIAA